jgi:hypothetical protein
MVSSNEIDDAFQPLDGGDVPKVYRFHRRPWRHCGGEWPTIVPMNREKKMPSGEGRTAI